MKDTKRLIDEVLTSSLTYTNSVASALELDPLSH